VRDRPKDRQTDHARSVTIGRNYVRSRSTAMRSKNTESLTQKYCKGYLHISKMKQSTAKETEVQQVRSVCNSVQKIVL